MMSANRISSSTSCSIWLPETSDQFLSELPPSPFLKLQHFRSNFPATNDRSLKEQYDLARNELSYVPEV
jgi:hypothetical protein